MELKLTTVVLALALGVANAASLRKEKASEEKIGKKVLQNHARYLASSSKRPEQSNLVRLLKKAIGSLNKKNHNVNTRSVNFENMYDLEQLFTLPSGDFLVKEAYSMLSEPLPGSPDQLKDEFNLDSTRTQEVETMSAAMESYIKNPATFATTVTMEMYPLFLQGRSQCPSTVLKKFLMRLWDIHYREMITEDGEVYRRFEQAARAVFPMFETMPDELTWFVGNAAENMASTLLNASTTLELALELRDVVNAAHILYNELLAMRSNPVQPADTTPFTTLIENTIGDVRCHTGNEIFDMHAIASYIFFKEYEEIEIEHVCQHITEFAYGYMARRVDEMPGVNMTWLEANIHWEELEPLCSWVRDFIHDEIFPSVDYYTDIVARKDSDEFMEMFNFLDTQELGVLEEVLARLGFQPGGEDTSSESSIGSCDRK